MNLFIIVKSNLKQKPLHTLLNVLLLGLGLGIVLLIMLIFVQIKENFTKNTKNIDLVVGAEGSPLQLVFSSVFYIDTPTGNISLTEAKKIMDNKLFVKKAIPISLGDNFKGFRIVGTNLDYPKNYEAQLAQGDWFRKPMEVTIGSNVAAFEQLKIGSVFVGGHGIEDDGNEELLHKAFRYKVVGILKPNKTAIDNLILTHLESVWEVHAHEDREDSTAHQHEKEEQEITALLIKFNSPLAAINLPRQVNALTNMQSASPIGEIARLLGILGIGVEVASTIGYILLAVAALSIFITIYNLLKERRYDLAMMRALGASKNKIFAIVMLQGFFITVLGIVFGLLLAHVGLEIMANFWGKYNQIHLTGFFWTSQEAVFSLLVVCVSLVVSAIPSLQVYKIDVVKTLQSNF